MHTDSILKSTVLADGVLTMNYKASASEQVVAEQLIDGGGVTRNH